MPSLIAKQPKDTRKQTTVSLSGSVLAELELYCQFIDSARDWVINESLKSVFSRDKAFQEWKERGGLQSSNGNGLVHPTPAVDNPTSDRTRSQRLATTETIKPV